MTVIVMKKGSLDVAQYNNVSNIAYSSGSVTITYGPNNEYYETLTYADYMLQIIP